VLGPRPPLAAHQDPAPHLHGSGADPFDRAEEEVADEDRARVRVVEDVEDLVGDEPVVHRHRDRPDRADRRRHEHAL